MLFTHLPGNVFWRNVAFLKYKTVIKITNEAIVAVIALSFITQQTGVYKF